MTGSPFSNVVGQAPGDSTFKNVESTNTTDSTDFDDTATTDDSTESSIGVERAADGTTHESGQDETVGDASSGAPAFGT